MRGAPTGDSTTRPWRRWSVPSSRNARTVSPTNSGLPAVRSWMLRVVANHAKNQVRSRIRRIRRDDRHVGLFLRMEDGTEQQAIQRLENLAVAEALGRLQLHEREVLGCRFVAELSEAETAEVLDVAIGTVKSRTSRALAKLKSELERAGSTEGDS